MPLVLYTGINRFELESLNRFVYHCYNNHIRTGVPICSILFSYDIANLWNLGLLAEQQYIYMNPAYYLNGRGELFVQTIKNRFTYDKLQAIMSRGIVIKCL